MHFAIRKRSDHDSYLVRWFEAGIKRRKNFATLGAATDWVRDQKKLVASGSSPFEVEAATRVAAGTGFALDVLVKAGLEAMQHKGAGRADAKMTFREASEKVISRAEKSDARERTVEGYRAMYKVLNLRFGDRAAVSLEQSEIENYLAGLPNKQGVRGQASLATKTSYLNHIRMCMKVAGIPLPLADIVVPADTSEIEYFTVDEIRTALSATPANARGFLAVALFACVRPENLEQVPATAVSVECRTIRIPQGIAKDRVTHILDEEVVPPVLWEWLDLYLYEPVAWAPLQRRLKKAIGRWIHDGIRHTGATFYCAVHGVAKTAQLLTHESEKLVRSNYAGTVQSRATAREFLALAPTSIKFVETAPRIMWPTDADLAEMLKRETGEQIAARLGCSDSMLTKHCRVRGIEKPGRGYWTTAA